MKKLLLATVLSITSIFGFGYSKNTTLDANTIRDAGNNTITIGFKVQSPDLMAIKHTIEYNPEEFEVLSITANSYFHKEQVENESGQNKKITILLDSENSFNSIEYMELNIKPTAKTNQGTIKIDNIEIANSNHKIEKTAGTILTVTIDDDNYKLFKEEIIMQNPIIKYIRENKKLVLTICGIVLIIIIINNVRKKIKKNKQKNKKYFTDMKTPEQTVEEISNEEGIELIKKVESEEVNNPISDDIFKGKYEIFILLFLIGSLFTFTKVTAISEYTQEIRTSILNNSTYNEKYDLNSDKKINLIDLIYAIESKDIVNKGDINFK
ncbi:MAG: hypothetical protein IJS56_04680 [Bacilli bacterium]|nr:hypothetical protein [Bacilli bacterium]